MKPKCIVRAHGRRYTRGANADLPYFETPKTSYTNSKGLKSGKTYYYKVRAYVEINGERHYTDYSTKASRKI